MAALGLFGTASAGQVASSVNPPVRRFHNRLVIARYLPAVSAQTAVLGRVRSGARHLARGVDDLGQCPICKTHPRSIRMGPLCIGEFDIVAAELPTKEPGEAN